ncbi:MAG TPA: FAD-binding protein, partial [Candidatus Limnocylindria bacterium]|nr:FAD-binding protein [Candidatus Limnocylindria bacterium]
VDPASRTASAEGGATWADFNAATNAHGLATTGGIVSTTGIGGLTLGGGIGYLARAFGLSCDNLIGADLVTADGELVHASEADSPDLFWAIRGGGGNFGAVTRFEYRLHPVAEIYGGPMFYDLRDAGDVLRFYRDYIADAPEQMGAFPGFHLAPPLPFIPEERHGTPMMLVVACWAGPVGEGEAALRPFHEVAPVVAEHVGVMPYPALNGAFDALFPAGLQHYWKTAFASTLTDGAIEAHLAWGPRVPAVSSVMHVYPINGASQRVPADATAFASRDASFATVIGGMWPDPADNEANIAWVRDYYAAIAPHSDVGGYVNFMSGDDQDKIRSSYRGNYDRLVQVKRRYDPANRFRINQNIRP